MRILVTNDDGVTSPGIKALAKALEALGEVTVVAPADQQSAIAHSITIYQPLTVTPLSNGKRGAVYAVDGTPADCIKLAVGEILSARPDLVVSGINHGGNVGINVLYSGTVAGAMEGAVLGIPAVAFSLDTHTAAKFDGYARLAVRWLGAQLPKLLQEPVAYNVNFPFIAPGHIKGFTFTRQLAMPYLDIFHRRIDPRGRTYFWLGADPVSEARWVKPPTPSGSFPSDFEAVRGGYASVTPLMVDRTHYDLLGRLAATPAPTRKKRR